MARDPVDTVVQQIQMVAMACGPAGMGVAAAVSIADAFYDYIRDANPNQVLSSWSQMQAFQDLADDMQRDLLIDKTQDIGATVRQAINFTKEINLDISKWETTNVIEADIQGWEAGVLRGPLTGKSGIAYFDKYGPAGTLEQVQFLGGYLSARSAYHGYSAAALKLRALSLNRGDDIAYLYVGNTVRNALIDSLNLTIIYAEPPIKKLMESLDPKTSWKVIDAANGCSSTTPKSREPYYAAFSEEVRKQREAAFTNSVLWTTQNKKDGYFDASVAEAISNFGIILEQTKNILKAYQSSKVPNKSQTGSAPKNTLGARKQNTIRVLFEYPPPQVPIDNYDTLLPGPVLGDGPDPAQYVAAEVVGSKDASTYFQFTRTGAAANSVSDALLSAGALDQVNTELVQAYEARFGVGKYAIDSKMATPPHVNTALAAPLVSGTGPVGAKTLALFFVGRDPAFFDLPLVPSPGSTAAAARASYDDLFQQLANWNATKPVPITALRLSLVSEQDLSGDMPSAYISAELATVVLDAAIAAMVASPQHLGDLTLLVPVNTAPGGWLRKAAFDQAARTRNAEIFHEGFDLPTV